MNEVIKDIKKVIKEKQTIIVATSGGPDSMALINILNNLKYDIVCAHVNHNLRKESLKESEMVKNYCKNNNIKYEYFEIKKYKGNKENYARNQRYSFFEKLTKKYQSKYLLTAHHGDDLIETVIMRIIRGSNFEGYKGFSKITKRNNYYIYRPLINVTKEEILKYCEDNNIKYAIDKTNFEDTYTRNRIRKYILPLLKKENKEIHKKFIKLSNMIEEYDSYINKQLETKYNEIDIEKFKKEEKIIQKKIIIKMLKEKYQNHIYKIKDIHINKIIDLINTSKPNTILTLPEGYVFIKSYNKAQIKKEKKEKPYNYIIEKEIKLKNNHIIMYAEDTKDSSNNILKINSKEIKLPLHVRSRKDGDKIEVKGLNGSKKLKDIFIDSKIPKEKRATYPIVTDDNDIILWIPGIKKSKFDNSKTKNYDIIIKYF